MKKRTGLWLWQTQHIRVQQLFYCPVANNLYSHTDWNFQNRSVVFLFLIVLKQLLKLKKYIYITKRMSLRFGVIMYMDFKGGAYILSVTHFHFKIWFCLLMKIKMNSSLTLNAHKLFHSQLYRLSFVIERQVVSL